MKDAKGRVLYVGKAANLKRRVSSYFLRPHDLRIERLVSEIAKIDFKETLNALEALVLESKFIKKYQPPYNIREKDDKSFLYVAVTKEEFPRVFLVRGKGAEAKKYGGFYGPFVSSSNIREALRIVRRIFPFSTHPAKQIVASRALASYGLALSVKPKFGIGRNDMTASRPCFDYEIGLCPGTCAGLISKQEYRKDIRNIKLIFSGKTNRILRSLEKEMKTASKKLDFERAGKLKRQLFALKHIQDSALISDTEVGHWGLEIGHSRRVEGPVLSRVEGYDISNISGQHAVGSMVVFVGGQPAKSNYRKFKIKGIAGPDDTGMIAEVISRRFSGAHDGEWPMPDLIVIDGGKGQVNAAKAALSKRRLSVPVVGIAKGPERKRNDFIGRIPVWADKKVLIRVRDEAHRFAVSYHRKLRAVNFLPDLV